MHYRYIVGFYIDPDGNKPVEQYLMDGKNLTDLEVIIHVIQRLALVGQDLIHTNMAKEINNPIFELRKDRHRIFYAPDGKRFVLLSAYLKKSPKTPRIEIVRAERNYQDYLKNGGFYPLKLPPIT